MELGNIFDNTYHELMMALARHNIFLINEEQTSPDQQTWLRTYFKEKVLRHISPILLTSDSDPVSFLKDQYTYLAVKMKNGSPRTICTDRSADRASPPLCSCTQRR